MFPTRVSWETAGVPIFAHANGFGWDEALMVMAPIAAVAGLLFLANSRAKRLTPDADADPVADPIGAPVVEAPDPRNGDPVPQRSDPPTD
jgi:hypothetical protein